MVLYECTMHGYSNNMNYLCTKIGQFKAKLYLYYKWSVSYFKCKVHSIYQILKLQTYYLLLNFKLSKTVNSKYSHF